MNLLGVVESNLGLKDAARASFQGSLDLDPTNDEAWYGLGLTYEDDDPPRALELLQKAIEIDGCVSAAHRELGYVLWRLDRDREAEISLNRALDLDERDSWTNNYLGRVLRRQGRLQEAEAALTRATELSPDEPFFLSNLADLYVVLGKDASARSSFARALALDMANPHTNLRVGLYLKNRGLFGKARQHLRRTLRALPEETRAIKALSEMPE